MPLIRSFIAIDTSPAVKEKISMLQEKLKTVGAEVRWEPREKFHITLKFLGAVEEGKLDSLSKKLEELLRAFTPFPVEFKNVGCFPSLHHPRVIWVGAESEGDSLPRMQERIEEMVSDLGFEKEERKFHAHITIARVKGSGNLKRLIQELANVTFLPESSHVREVLLMKSDLRPTGSVYSVLRAYKLAEV